MCLSMLYEQLRWAIYKKRRKKQGFPPSQVLWAAAPRRGKQSNVHMAYITPMGWAMSAELVSGETYFGTSEAPKL